MKNKLYILALGIFTVGFLSACKQAPNILEPMPMKTGGGSTPANPAILFDSVITGGWSTIVMDTDGTHRTIVWTGENPGVQWSPGSSILFSGGLDSICAFDVSVNSNGVPVGSNYRTITSHTHTVDSEIIVQRTWSSTSAVNKIAFSLLHWRKSGPPMVATVSANGGAWNTLHSFPATYAGNGSTNAIYGLAWNSDDSKIAVLVDSMFKWMSIVIIDASTGATTDSIPLPGSPTWRLLDWSRSGLNSLLLFDSSGRITYLTPTSGSSPSTNGVVADWPTWSPNNSSVMYFSTTQKIVHGVDMDVTALKKVIPLTGVTSTVVSNFSSVVHDYNSPVVSPNWHR